MEAELDGDLAGMIRTQEECITHFEALIPRQVEKGLITKAMGEAKIEFLVHTLNLLNEIYLGEPQLQQGHTGDASGGIARPVGTDTASGASPGIGAGPVNSARGGDD